MECLPGALGKPLVGVLLLAGAGTCLESRLHYLCLALVPFSRVFHSFTIIGKAGKVRYLRDFNVYRNITCIRALHIMPLGFSIVNNIHASSSYAIISRSNAYSLNVTS
jgi:hypothetical protein